MTKASHCVRRYLGVWCLVFGVWCWLSSCRLTVCELLASRGVSSNQAQRADTALAGAVRHRGSSNETQKAPEGQHRRTPSHKSSNIESNVTQGKRFASSTSGWLMDIRSNMTSDTPRTYNVPPLRSFPSRGTITGALRHPARAVSALRA